MKHRDDAFALTSTGFRIIPIEYRRVRDIMAEFDTREWVLRQALKEGHGVEITDEIAEACVLFVVCDQEMAEKMKTHRIPNPTLCQLIGTSRAIGLSQKDAEAKFRAILNENN